MPDRSILQMLPSIDSVLARPEIRELEEKMPHVLLADAAREAVETVRRELTGQTGAVEKEAILDRVISLAVASARKAAGPIYCKAINATGIILHTGLGRAVLPRRAIEQIASELAGYSVLQIDLETGLRSKRDARIASLISKLTGAESAMVVNNNAAATALVLNTFGKGREVIVSRGQLIEIGGSFRLPDVMAASGARLVEVGTTNKTHAYDYENAINENTAAIMRVHPSNYRITGFTEEVELTKLVEIAHRHNLVMIDDVGAGALIDFSRFGFEYEPMLKDSIEAGADVVTCSADKLIGSCQGGIILGSDSCIKSLQKNPFARIVRVDKLTLATLEATLMLFLDEQRALAEVPTLAMLKRTLAEISEQANWIADELKARSTPAEVSIGGGQSQMGSGSLPTQGLATRLVCLKPLKITAQELALCLRQYNPPVITRIHDEQVLIDPRTLLEGERQTVAEAVCDVLK
jgi:L-seryl-tRNA(Ser) seleniumtransferase